VYWAQKVGVFGMLLSSIGLFFNWWCKKDERVTALTGKITELEQQIATDKEAADEFKRQVAKDKEAAEKAAKEQADEIVELTKQLDTQKTASDAQAKELRQIKQHLRTMGLLPKEGEDA
jgi:predicted RNase H-like nuclease (RuvC/YqgF family)